MISFLPFPKIGGGFFGRAVGSPSATQEKFFPIKQVHGDHILVLRSAEEIRQRANAESDAVICAIEETPVLIKTADCVPILIAHPQGVIAGVHAGWRGTALRILEKTLLKMQKEFSLDLSEIKLAIGPAICGNCYEVGEEVIAALSEKAGVRKTKEGKFLLDLKELNHHQALGCGVQKNQIEIRQECTLCDEKNFFSYRGAMKSNQQNTGRNLAWVKIKLPSLSSS